MSTRSYATIPMSKDASKLSHGHPDSGNSTEQKVQSSVGLEVSRMLCVARCHQNMRQCQWGRPKAMPVASERVLQGPKNR